MGLEDGRHDEQDATQNSMPETFNRVPGAADRYQYLIGLSTLELSRMTRDEHTDELSAQLAAHILTERKKASGWKPDYDPLDEWDKE